MLMATGNLAQVREQVAVGEIVDYAGASELNAESVPGQVPRWHIVETHASHERIVAAHLVGRRFGAYLPEMQYLPEVNKRGELRRGQKLPRTRLLVVGYVFVFVWDIEKHWERIMGIPGVAQIMRNVERRPIVLPDAAIDRIRAAENLLSPGQLVDVMKKAKRRWRKSRMPDNDDGGEVVISRCWDPLMDVEVVDSQGKNQTLGTLLGLAS